MIIPILCGIGIAGGLTLTGVGVYLVRKKKEAGKWN